MLPGSREKMSAEGSGHRVTPDKGRAGEVPGDLQAQCLGERLSGGAGLEVGVK